MRAGVHTIQQCMRDHLSALFFGVVIALTPQTGQCVDAIDRIVAIVNNDVIVMSELDFRVTQVQNDLIDSNTQAPPYHILQQQVLERLIVDRLQLQLADRIGIRVIDDELNVTITNIANNNGLTLRQFRDVLEREGYDFRQFRQQIKDEMRISQLRQREIGSQIMVSDREVENYLAIKKRIGDTDIEYRLQHILIALPDGASAKDISTAKEQADTILTELRHGADFAEMAVRVSDGQNALKGGDIGWKKAGQLPVFFTAALANLDVGDVSELIKSPNGFHIIRIAENRYVTQHMVTQTLARHILIRPNELISDSDAVTRLNNLSERIKNGESFGEIAKVHSDDRGSAIKDGELGWRNPGDFVAKFETEINALNSGELSSPFKTQFGWHIVQVISRRQHDNTELVKRASARETLRQRKIEEEGRAWLRQLRDGAYVEVRLDEGDF